MRTARMSRIALAGTALLVTACGTGESSSSGQGDVVSASVQEPDAATQTPAAEAGTGDLRSGVATFQLSTGVDATADVLCQLDPAGAGEPDKQVEITSTSSPAFTLVVFKASLPSAEVTWQGEQTWRGDPDVVAIKADALISGYGSFTATGEGNDSVPGRFHVDCDV